MCAIMDANVESHIFGKPPNPGGKFFLKWVSKGTYRLVVGGELLRELKIGSPGFRQWFSEAIKSAKVRQVDDEAVDRRTQELLTSTTLKSDDPHVIALAQLSGARLLYSHDNDLQDDFHTKSLIDNPEGKIYTTLRSIEITATHRSLLRRRDLCTR